MMSFAMKEAVTIIMEGGGRYPCHRPVSEEMRELVNQGLKPQEVRACGLRFHAETAKVAG